MEKNIVLVSNVNDPRNTTTGHFFNKLSTPLDLEGRWKVGLRKMIYLNTTHNINSDAYIEIKHHAESNKIRNPDRQPELLVDLINPRDLNVHFRLNDRGDHTVLAFYFNYWKDKPKTEFRYVSFEYRLGNSGKKNYSHDVEGLETYKFPFPKDYYAAGDPSLPSGDVVNDLYVKIGYWYTHRTLVPQGYYNTIESLFSTINELPGDLKEWVHFEYNRRKNRSSIKVKNILLKHIILSDHLKHVLGFKNNLYIPSTITRRIVGENELELHGGIFPLHILTNIIEPMNVGGDVYQPMLETISIDANREHFGEIIEHVVKSPLYRPVAIKGKIDEIEIQIVDDLGRQVRFDNIHGDAKTLLVLHFYRDVDYK